MSKTWLTNSPSSTDDDYKQPAAAALRADVAAEREAKYELEHAERAAGRACERAQQALGDAWMRW